MAQLVEIHVFMTKLQMKVKISMVNYGSLGQKGKLKEGLPGSACVGVNFQNCGCLTSKSKLGTQGNNKELNCLKNLELGV